MTYGLYLKRTTQRKFHFHEHLEVQHLPHLNEHILIDGIKYKVVDIVHQFSTKLVNRNLLETEQYGSIYAEQ